MTFLFSIAVSGNEVEDEHYDFIYSHYPNADEIYESQAFDDWLADQPSPYRTALEKGTAEEVVAVFDAFETLISRILAETGSKLSKDLPVMIDSKTRWDSVSGVGGSFMYRYTLVKYEAEPLNQQQIDRTKSHLVSNNCSVEDIAYFLDAGVPVNHIYSNRNGKIVANITITSSDCR